MARGALAVDGSARTLTCVVVIPSSGSAVGGRVGGANVSVAGGNELGGKVTVMTKSVGVEELEGEKFKPQLETSRAAGRIKKMALCTGQL